MAWTVFPEDLGWAPNTQFGQLTTSYNSSSRGLDAFFWPLESLHTHSRQTDRQTDRQTETHRQTDRQTETHTQTDRQTDRHTDRHTDTQRLSSREKKRGGVV